MQKIIEEKSLGNGEGMDEEQGIGGGKVAMGKEIAKKGKPAVRRVSVGVGKCGDGKRVTEIEGGRSVDMVLEEGNGGGAVKGKKLLVYVKDAEVGDVEGLEFSRVDEGMDYDVDMEGSEVEGVVMLAGKEGGVFGGVDDGIERVGEGSGINDGRMNCGAGSLGEGTADRGGDMMGIGKLKNGTGSVIRNGVGNGEEKTERTSDGGSGGELGGLN